MNRFDIKRKWEEFQKKREQKKATASSESESKDTIEESTLETSTEEHVDTQAESPSTPSAPTMTKDTTTTDEDDTIDLREIGRRLWKKKWWFAALLPVAAVVSAIIIVDVPRTYTTSTTMAPEIENPVSSGGALSSIAASFGFDMSAVQSTDAISPTLYPDLMEDNGFVASLFNIRVVTADKSVDTTYYAYMRYHQDQSWLSQQGDTIMKKIEKMFPKSNNEFKGNTSKSQFNPYFLSKKDDGIVNKMRDDIGISVDKKRASSLSPPRHRTRWSARRLPTPCANACRTSSSSIVPTRHAATWSTTRNSPTTPAPNMRRRAASMPRRQTRISM